MEEEEWDQASGGGAFILDFFCSETLLLIDRFQKMPFARFHMLGDKYLYDHLKFYLLNWQKSLENPNCISVPC